MNWLEQTKIVVPYQGVNTDYLSNLQTGIQMGKFKLSSDTIFRTVRKRWWLDFKIGSKIVVHMPIYSTTSADYYSNLKLV